MRASARFISILVLALALLSAAAYAIVARTARTWFEADVALRARLAVHSAQASLSAHWLRGDFGTLQGLLHDITRDERIMSATACAIDGTTLTSTEGYPRNFACEVIAAELASMLRRRSAGGVRGWTGTGNSQGGLVQVNAVPIVAADRDLGAVVLVHDLSFVSKRESAARIFLLAVFGVLALAASSVTLVAARFARRGWMAELRRVLRSDDAHPEYQPLLKDVRALVQRLSQESQSGLGSGAWTPERLKAVLSQHVHGERVVIVANREPYIHQRDADGCVHVQHPASGLVTALEPVMRACSGVWVAHGSGSADRQMADAKGRVRVPPGEESYVVHRVWLSEAEEQGYYYGFANEGLWPLSHVAHDRPAFRAEDWKHYRTVNRKFADAVCEEVDADDPIILVQDYHFALVPKMIRQRLPRATILTFWHIPWPNAERFGICPWRHELLEGLMGSSILGFQTQLHCNNFLDAVDTFVEARIDRERNAVVQGASETLVRPYPISIEWPVRWLRDCPSISECRRLVLEDLHLPADTLLGVGVDRLDYTKGIEERLLAVDRLLEKHPELKHRFTFVQLAAPSRTKIERYRQLNEVVEETARRINAKHGSASYSPIVLLRAHHEPPAVFRYYRAANFCYVSSLHDGMNLVAKEFVAAREDERGVLVLSHFTGAARELSEALIVNPYDLEQASDALAVALAMPEEEQRERMRFMRGLVSQFNVYRWAGRILVDAAELRRRGRLSGRLARVRDLHARTS